MHCHSFSEVGTIWNEATAFVPSSRWYKIFLRVPCALISIEDIPAFHACISWVIAKNRWLRFFSEHFAVIIIANNTSRISHLLILNIIIFNHFYEGIIKIVISWIVVISWIFNLYFFTLSLYDLILEAVILTFPHEFRRIVGQSFLGCNLLFFYLVACRYFLPRKKWFDNFILMFGIKIVFSICWSPHWNAVFFKSNAVNR